MNQEIKNLITFFENKLASYWQLEGQLHEITDDDRAYKLESRLPQLEKDVDLARGNLVAAIERLEQKPIDNIWEDRMGGQFTREEIDRAARGGEGW